MLGPNQEKWLAALESGEWPQGTGSLCIKGNYCCLGVAAELFKEHAELIEDCGDTIVYNREGAVAPLYVQEALSLFNEVGSDKEAVQHLTIMNDDGVSFEDIAKKIRAEPHCWFREPK